jgi:hypothetical protein
MRHSPICIGLAALLTLAASSHTTAARAVQIKPAITGFIDMQNITWHDEDDGRPVFTLTNVKKYPGLFGGIVFNATWDEMQRRKNGPLTTTRLDRALDQVRRYNTAHPRAPLGVKLRIFGGNQAPPWAKVIAGGPVTLQRNPLGCSTPGNCPITIGKVWDPAYIAAWRAFQKKVAQQYDSEPLIRSVAITSCGMETDEPFVMPVVPPYPTGYTDAAGKACLRGAVEDYAAWRRTPIDFTINSFEEIQQGSGNFDPDFSIVIMKRCRHALGKRCELGNHAFSSKMKPGNTFIVEAIADRGAPIHYQTVGPKRNQLNWAATMRAARQYNAAAIELWPDKQYGGFTTLSLHKMRQLNTIFNRAK